MAVQRLSPSSLATLKLPFASYRTNDSLLT